MLKALHTKNYKDNSFHLLSFLIKNKTFKICPLLFIFLLGLCVNMVLPEGSFHTHTACSVFLSYYNLEDTSHESINKYLSNLVERSLRDLECSYCIEIKEVCVYTVVLLK